MMQPKPWETEIWREGFLNYLKQQKQSDKQLEAVLRIAARDAEREILRLKGKDNIGSVVRRAQYQAVLKTLQQQQKQLWRKINSVTEEGIKLSAEIAASTAAEVTARLGLSLEASGYNVAKQFELAAEQGIESVKARAISEIDLSKNVYNNRALTSGKINRIINSGLASNKSALEMAKDVKGFISPSTPGGVDFAAKRLARTEINNAFHTTSVLTASEQPWVDGVKWHLSGSHPKPDACNDYADKDSYHLGAGVFTAGKVPGKPHPQCLCYTTTITTPDKEFVNNFKNGKYDAYLKSYGY